MLNMLMNLKKNFVYILLHLVVFLLGFTAILGKLISLNAVNLVFYRTAIATIASLLLALVLNVKLRIGKLAVFKLMFIGLLVGLHWITFFGAIKASNVCVTLACLGVSTLFTAVAEPISQKRKISSVEVLVGVLIILGLATVFNFEIQYVSGIILGVVSFVIAGVFSVLNKNISHKYDALTVNFYEIIAAAVSILVYLLINGSLMPITQISSSDWIWLLVLGVLCTSFAFTATVWIMKQLSAYDVVLAINLEPIYGIFLAYFIFGNEEKMTPGFYAGVTLVIFAVFAFPFLKRRFPAN